MSVLSFTSLRFWLRSDKEYEPTGCSFFLMEIPYGGLNHELILKRLAKSDSNVSACTQGLSLPHTSHCTHRHTDMAVISLYCFF